MHLNDAVDLTLADVGQSDVVSVEEGEAGIVVLEVAGLAHTGRILIDEAEDAFVTAGLLFVHQGCGKFEPDINVVFFLAEAVILDLALAGDGQLDLFLAEVKTVIENVVDLSAIY